MGGNGDVDEVGLLWKRGGNLLFAQEHLGKRDALGYRCLTQVSQNLKKK